MTRGIVLGLMIASSRTMRGISRCDLTNGEHRGAALGNRRTFEVLIVNGDLLYLYTDGATDAINRKEELFGEERLMQALNAQPDQSLQGLLVSIKREIDCFAGEPPSLTISPCWSYGF